MTSQTDTGTATRVVNGVGIIDIVGDVTPAVDAQLAEAFDRASLDGARPVALNFDGLAYMNSGGIGLVVQLLVRANRTRHALHAYGLSEHYRHIFELTKLDEAIGIHPDEQAALAAIGGPR